MHVDRGELRAQLPVRPRTRFAPSPTGYLHLGHVVNAIYTWGLARAVDGVVLLRIENHDRVRCRPEFETALLEDLAWLGFAPDEGPYWQTDEGPYREGLHVLRTSAHVYACDCSRRVLEHAGEPPLSGYPGRCRSRRLEDGPGRALRVEIGEGHESFVDLALGPRTQHPLAQCGDLAVRDRDGHWTYQFSVTVDDLRQDIDLVVRGIDLIESTGRQLRLRRLLGGTRPLAFCHHPLVWREPGRKLSKSNRDSGVRDLRRAGCTPADVIGRAACAVGLIDEPRPVPAQDVSALVMRGTGPGA